MKNLKIFTLFILTLIAINLTLSVNEIIDLEWANIAYLFLGISYIVYFGRLLWKTRGEF